MSSLGLFRIKPLWTFLCLSFGGHKHSFLLGVRPGTQGADAPICRHCPRFSAGDAPADICQPTSCSPPSPGSQHSTWWSGGSGVGAAVPDCGYNFPIKPGRSEPVLSCRGVGDTQVCLQHLRVTEVQEQVLYLTSARRLGGNIPMSAFSRQLKFDIANTHTYFMPF